MLFEFHVRHSEFTFLYHPSAVLEVRCASSTFNITYLANCSSCRSCLRRCCTSTSLQSFLQLCRGVKSTALSSIYKLPPGSVVPSWIVAELSHILFDGFDVNRHLASVPGRLQSCSSGSSQQLQLVLFDMVDFFSASGTKSCSDEFLSTSDQGGLPVSMICQQCRTPSTNRMSTMSNSCLLYTSPSPRD